MIQIKLNKYPDYSKKITINGTLYVFNIRWNDAFEFWALSVTDENNTAIASNIRMVQNFDLFREKRGLGLPVGKLMLLNSTGAQTPVTFDNVEEFALVYSE